MIHEPRATMRRRPGQRRLPPSALLGALLVIAFQTHADQQPAPWQPLPSAGQAPGVILVAGRRYATLPEAAGALRDGEQLDIGPGEYEQPLVIRANGVRVRGHGLVVIQRTSAEDKAAIITKGNDIHIVNITCREIAVPHGNGACVRHEGRNLTLEHVYFHDAEQGLLSGYRSGAVRILRSRFERLGKAGRAHGIYVGGGSLQISHSQFLASKDEGHEIKSRATSTVIEHSVIASLDGLDSRLIDVSQGGRLSVRNCVLQQGPATSNNDLIGFALERKPHPQHSVELRDNLIIVDSPKRARLFHAGVDIDVTPSVQGNRVIGPVGDRYPGFNQWLPDRAAAGLAPYPMLPAAPLD